jgi:hypothetical protein
MFITSFIKIFNLERIFVLSIKPGAWGEKQMSKVFSKKKGSERPAF